MADSREQTSHRGTQDPQRTISNGEPKVLSFPRFPRPTVRVPLWEETGRRPDEEALRAWLTGEGYGVVRWANEPATGYPPHAHIYRSCSG